MKVWTTPTHVAVYEDGQLDIIERSTGDALLLKCTAKTAAQMLKGDTAACIAVLLRAFSTTPLVRGMAKPSKLAYAYPIAEQNKVQS